MGADAFKPLCRIACNYCESNLRFISGNRPGLLKDISDLIDDTYDLTPATAASDPNSLFTFALMDLVQPLANYVIYSVLDCAPYSALFSMRLIIESLAVGLYADRWFGDTRLEDRLRLAGGFEMGRFRRCEEGRGGEDFELCSQYGSLSNRVNEALGWLRGWLGSFLGTGTEPMDFIYETYNSLSKPIHAVAMIDGRVVLGALGIIAADYVLSKDGFPPMRTIVMPVECDENDLAILDEIHWKTLLTRLSMDMLIYAWGVVTRSMSNEELEKAKAKIEEALKRIDEVDKELKNRYRSDAKTYH
ncbi:MAG: hypothetical protein RXO54_04455 [Acidilobus sp.]